MNQQLNRELRPLWPICLICVLLPAPTIVFWRTEDGRRMAIWLFMLGCISLVAYSFRGEVKSDISPRPARTIVAWRTRMVALGAALLAAYCIFAALWLGFIGTDNLVGVVLACLSLIPALCVTPFLTLLTRKPVAGVVFTGFLLGATKLLSCAVVVLIYGWHADALGHTRMLWTNPNLLVWLFLLNNCVLAISFYFFGRRRFLQSDITHLTEGPAEFLK